MEYDIIEQKEILHEAYAELVARLRRFADSGTVTDGWNAKEDYARAKEILENLLSPDLNTMEQMQSLREEYLLMKDRIPRGRFHHD